MKNILPTTIWAVKLLIFNQLIRSYIHVWAQLESVEILNYCSSIVNKGTLHYYKFYFVFFFLV